MSSDDRPTLYGPDGHSAYESRGLVSALGAPMSRRTFLRGAGLAALGGGLTAILAACGTSTGGGTSSATPATDYAKQIGLNLDVSTYDTLMRSRTGTLTPTYQGWLDVLDTIQNEGLVDQAKLQSYVDYFGTVGPMTLAALGKTYAGWKHDAQFYPNTPFNPPDFLGWIDLNAMLPDFDIPTTDQSRFFGDMTPVPINQESWSIGLANWAVSGSVGSNYFSVVEGYTNAVGTEVVQNTGTFDMSFVRPTDANGNPTVAWHAIYAPNIIPGTVDAISTDPWTFSQQVPNYEVDHNGYSFAIKVVVPDDDGILLKGISTVRFGMGHTLPTTSGPNQQQSSYPGGGQVGATIQPGQLLGYADPYLGPVFELDFSVFAPPSANIGFGPQLDANLGSQYVLDIAGGKAYPQGQRPIATRTHWLDSRAYGPLFDANGNALNVPNQPNMPF